MKVQFPFSKTRFDVSRLPNSEQGAGREHDETYELTELGKEKASDYAAEGPRLRVLLCLAGGPKSTSEIVERTGISAERVVEILEDFGALQWIRRKMG